MSDATLLLLHMRDYADELRHHLDHVAEEARGLEDGWHALRDVYHGQAAEHFHGVFAATRERFEAYTLAGRQVLTVLERRLADLERFDAQEPGLG